ncbi:MAG: acyltransferase [Bacteroidaceae bacterium]|nr:acyltransferase [Bacteroidaceae bacterium]
MTNRLKGFTRKYTKKKLWTVFDERYGFCFLERLFSCNWFNPFATIWLNLRSFPLSQAICFPIWCYGRPKFYGLSGHMIIEGKIASGMIRFNQTKYMAPSNMDAQTELFNYGKIIFRGPGIIGTGNKIVVFRSGTLDIGANFKITDMCNVGCFQQIIIGEQTRITHRCQVLESNYHFVANFAKGIVPKHSRPISLGKGCWICNSSTIMGGTKLPDFTLVASNSLLNKNYSEIPESSLIGGIPARLIATGFRKIENGMIETEIAQFYKMNPNQVFCMPESANPNEYSYVDKFK